MIRYYCDSCGQEIPGKSNAVANRIKVKHGRLSVEVIVAIDNVWNGGHACRLCVREAIRAGDPIGARIDGLDDAGTLEP